MSKHSVMVGSKNSLLTQKNLKILQPVWRLEENEKKKESLLSHYEREDVI